MKNYIILWDNGKEELINALNLNTGRRYFIGKGWCFIEQLAPVQAHN